MTSSCKTVLMGEPMDDIYANRWIYFAQAQWIISFGTSIFSLSAKFVLQTIGKLGFWFFLVESIFNVKVTILQLKQPFKKFSKYFVSLVAHKSNRSNLQKRLTNKIFSNSYGLIWDACLGDYSNIMAQKSN